MADRHAFLSVDPADPDGPILVTEVTPIGYIVTATRDGKTYYPGDDYEIEAMLPTLEEARLRCSYSSDIWTTGIAAVIPIPKEN